MTDLHPLNDHFAIPGILAFHQTPGGLIYAAITTPQATATVYLQGAHIAAWQPTGHDPVLFTSHKSEFAPGKAIRGGVPIVFPWFGPRKDGKPGPSHGFARLQDWTLAFAAVSGEDLHLSFTLSPSDLSRSLGYDTFRLAYQLIIGRTLTLQLTVANDGPAPLVFEEALHTYFNVHDVQQAHLNGLDGVTYLDKIEDFRANVQLGPITPVGPTDRVYLHTTATCTLDDTAGKRRITIAKTNSATTVVWNPWGTGASRLPDLGPEWREFLAVETANASEDAVTLPPGATHTMQTLLSINPL
ncbi:MAG: D-hexose-6-phosphate mutarotase [Acidobacteriota bacterium]|nr:D-hexose-6-phosphate mutarotase [Acidobacteriota bacterium]